MDDTIYKKRVTFSSKYHTKRMILKLRKTTVPQWTILQITDKGTRSLVLYLFLDDGSETSSDIVLTLPLHAKLSPDVHNYTCEPLFQDGRDGKKIIELVKQISNVRTFTVDVDHTPPSTYTVMDLHSSDIEMGSPPLGTKKFNLIFLKDTETGGILLHTTDASMFTFPVQLRPVSDYELMTLRGCRIQNHCYLITAVALCSFKTYMTKQEVSMLHEKTLMHMSSINNRKYANYVPVSHLYRSKPQRHFWNIYNKTNGIMYKYVKNFGGDPSSALNRKLHGLFFSANVNPTTGLPPAVSYYGDQRIHIPASFMINSDMNMYFADFYCHYTNHHVTLVVTLNGSDADLFCRKRLLSLNSKFNEFLFRRPHEFHAMVSTKVTVEVFYTEDIDISELLEYRVAFESFVPQKGNAAYKTYVGLPKREDCKICNLKTKNS